MGFVFRWFMKTLNLILKIILSLIVLSIIVLLIWIGLYIFVPSVREFTNNNVLSIQLYEILKLKVR